MNPKGDVRKLASGKHETPRPAKGTGLKTLFLAFDAAGQSEANEIRDQRKKLKKFKKKLAICSSIQ